MESQKIANDFQEHLGNIHHIAQKLQRNIRIMEVCGTHTVAIFKAGLRQLLPANIELISGPGCPVCVTDESNIDQAIAYLDDPHIILTTFGDMLKVRGSEKNLAEVKAEGKDIRVLYSPLDALNIAQENPKKDIIFFAVGFETTAPTEAATVLFAKAKNIKNFSLLSAQKLVPPILKFLLDEKDTHIDALLLPGHVATITGLTPFSFLEKYHVPSVVGGFTPLEIILALEQILQQIAKGRAKVENAYQNVVQNRGNQKAQSILQEVYEDKAATWRGIGRVDSSGLKMRENFRDFDSEKRYPLNIKANEKKPSFCKCTDVLKGIITPPKCPLFKKKCTPLHAEGPCMVSVEGVCAAWYKYGDSFFAWQ